MGFGLGTQMHPDEEPTSELEPYLTQRAIEPDLATLYRIHASRLIGLMWAFLGDRAMAEDVVQDTFVRVGRRWADIRDMCSAPAYLRSTAFNLARSRLRHRVVARRHTVEAPGLSPSAEDRTMLRAEQQEVADALQALSARQRACLVLRYYEDMTDVQIAADLGLSPSSVKTYIARGLAALDSRLEGRL
jgi:RNA polymerase sigma-70 factor (sigma-E family)